MFQRGWFNHHLVDLFCIYIYINGQDPRYTLICVSGFMAGENHVINVIDNCNDLQVSSDQNPVFFVVYMGFPGMWGV